MRRESGAPRQQLKAEDNGSPIAAGPLAWSIRRAIEILDEAIDRIGDQLAQSAGLYADSPTEASSLLNAHGSRRSVRRDPLDADGPLIDHELDESPSGPELR